MKPLLLPALFLCSISFADELPNIAEILQPAIDRRQLAGAVALVADKDRILSLDAVGAADIAAKKPMATDALFKQWAERRFGKQGP